MPRSFILWGAIRPEDSEDYPQKVMITEDGPKIVVLRVAETLEGAIARAERDYPECWDWGLIE